MCVNSGTPGEVVKHPTHPHGAPTCPPKLTLNMLAIVVGSVVPSGAIPPPVIRQPRGLTSTVHIPGKVRSKRAGGVTLGAVQKPVPLAGQKPRSTPMVAAVSKSVV